MSLREGRWQGREQWIRRKGYWRQRESKSRERRRGDNLLPLWLRLMMEHSGRSPVDTLLLKLQKISNEEET